MRRREFLAAGAAAAVLAGRSTARDDGPRTFATPAEAMKSPRERVAYVTCTRVGSAAADRPDFLATVDVDPVSPSYGRILHRLAMPEVGDELHHFGWNACASCHGQRARRYLVVPGLRSSRIHVIDTADPVAPRHHKVIEPAEIVEKAKLTAPHTVHCLADGRIMLSMLGDENGEGPGGFLLLTEDFQVDGRWEASTEGMNYNYDFWYQPRRDVMVSSEWAAPNTVRPGFNPKDVGAGKYGHHLHFWDWTARKIAKSIDLGDSGMIPLEVRFHHDPDSGQGFVGAALSSTIWRWWEEDGDWKARKVIAVDPVAGVKGFDFPLPGLITDLVLSMDDKWLYFSNWLHGDVRQYDVSDPTRPRLAGQLWLGGLLGKGRDVGGKAPLGGPQMLQLSLDGKRLYVTDSLFSSWDDQFYPKLGQEGSRMLAVDCDTERGGLAMADGFAVDFLGEDLARAHEVRFPAGDSTSDIWH